MSVAAFDPACDMPSAIRLQTVSRRLILEWADGASIILTHEAVRAGCRCAGCEAQRRRGLPVASDSDVCIVRAEPMGPGALRFVFSDGHDRGIYPFSHLRQLASALSSA